MASLGVLEIQGISGGGGKAIGANLITQLVRPTQIYRTSLLGHLNRQNQIHLPARVSPLRRATQARQVFPSHRAFRDTSTLISSTLTPSAALLTRTVTVITSVTTIVNPTLPGSPVLASSYTSTDSAACTGNPTPTSSAILTISVVPISGDTSASGVTTTVSVTAINSVTTTDAATTTTNVNPTSSTASLDSDTITNSVTPINSATITTTITTTNDVTSANGVTSTGTTAVDNATPTVISTLTSSASPISTAVRDAGFVNAAYFVNWTSSDPTKDAICVEQLRILKQNNPSLKVILSIGGSNTSRDDSFSTLASTDATRYVFASSSVAMMQDYGFDGIDINWEYPETVADGANLALLIKEVRSALDILGNDYNKHHFLLTIACPATPNRYRLWPLADLVQYVDFFNFMGFDYMGAGISTRSGHQSNLYKSSTNPSSTDYETESAIDDYIRAGVPPFRIILGMPTYGRSFDNTELGGSYSMPTSGTWVDADTGEGMGIWDYKALPKLGAMEIYAQDAGATYSYDSDTGELISYDTAEMVSRKTEYVLSMGLGGAYFWEASADRTDGSSLILTSATIFREAGGLDATPNYVF
ncbi:endochitinase [Seiridium cupressi]